MLWLKSTSVTWTAIGYLTTWGGCTNMSCYNEYVSVNGRILWQRQPHFWIRKVRQPYRCQPKSERLDKNIWDKNATTGQLWIRHEPHRSLCWRDESHLARQKQRSRGGWRNHVLYLENCMARWTVNMWTVAVGIVTNSARSVCGAIVKALRPLWTRDSKTGRRDTKSQDESDLSGRKVPNELYASRSTN